LAEYSQFPPELQLSHDTEGYKKIVQLQLKLSEVQDQALYEDFLKYKNIDRTQEYLQNAPLQTMKTEVSKYKTYLESIEPNATLSNLYLSVIINWEKDVQEANDNIVRVYRNGEEVIKKENVTSQIYTSINLGLSQKFSAESSKKLIVKITVLEEDIFFDDPNGSGTIIKYLSYFVKGYPIKLTEDGKLMATAFVKIIGYPKKPNLSAWHGKR